MGAGIGLSKISPLAGMAVSKMQGNKGNPKAGGLGKITAFQTKSAILCLTTDDVYVYEAKQGFGGLKLKDPLYVWPREGLKISAVPQKATAAIDIELADGTAFEVETMLLGQNSAQLDEFLSVLGQ